MPNNKYKDMHLSSLQLLTFLCKSLKKVCKKEGEISRHRQKVLEFITHDHCITILLEREWQINLLEAAFGMHHNDDNRISMQTYTLCRGCRSCFCCFSCHAMCYLLLLLFPFLRFLSCLMFLCLRPTSSQSSSSYNNNGNDIKYIEHV